MANSFNIELQALSPSQLMDNVYAFENSVLSTAVDFDSNDLEGDHTTLNPLQSVPCFIKRMPQSGYKRCLLHDNEDLAFYCRDCRKSICNKCQKNHKKHDIILYSLCLTEKYDNLVASLSQFKILEESLLSAEKKASEKKNETEQTMVSVEKNIKTYFDNVRLKLDNLQQEMTEQVTALAADYFAKCARTCSDLATTRKEIEPFTTIVSDIHSHVQSESELFSLEEQIRHKLIEVKDSLTSLSGIQNLRFDLKWNENIDKEVLCLKNFGSVKAKEVSGHCSLVRQFHVGICSDKSSTCIESIAALTNGNLAVVDIANKKVKVFSQLGRHCFTFVGSGNFFVTCPSQVVAVDSGRMIVSDPGSGKIVLFNSNGTGLTTYDAAHCHAICCFNKSRSLKHNAARIGNQSRISMKTSEAKYLSIKTDHVDDASPIKSAEVSYDILVCNTLQKSMETVSVTGKDVSSNSNELLTMRSLFDNGDCSDLRHITVNTESESIFVTSPRDCSLSIFSTKDGSLVNSYSRKDGLGCPGSLAIDRDGNLIVADTLNNRVHELDSKGKFLRFLTFETDRSVGPESGSYLLLDEILGFSRYTFNISRPFAIAFDSSAEMLWIAEETGSVKQFKYYS